jgi:hypothetical protein
MSLHTCQHAGALPATTRTSPTPRQRTVTSKYSSFTSGDVIKQTFQFYLRTAAIFNSSLLVFCFYCPFSFGHRNIVKAKGWKVPLPSRESGLSNLLQCNCTQGIPCCLLEGNTELTNQRSQSSKAEVRPSLRRTLSQDKPTWSRKQPE